MKKSPVIILLLVLVLFLAGIYALAKTPPLNVKDPSPAKLTPSYAVFAVYAKDAGKKWKRLLRARALRDFVKSEGTEAFRKNYLIPFFDSFFPKASAKHISGHFAKLLGRDVMLSKYESDDGDAWLFVARLNTRQKVAFWFMRKHLAKNNKLKALTIEGIPAYEIKVSSEKTMLHAVAGNYVLFASRHDVMEQSLSLASGKSSDSFYELPALCGKGFETCFSSTDARPPSAPLFTVFIIPSVSDTTYHEVIHFLDFADDERLHTAVKMFGVPIKKSSGTPEYFKKALLLLPKDAVFIANTSFTVPLRQGESLEAFLVKQETRDFAKEYLNLNFMSDLLPLLDGAAILASTKIHTLSDETPMPDFMLLLPLKAGDKPASQRKAVLAVMDKIFSHGMKDVYEKKEQTVYGTRVVSYVHKKKKESAVLSPSYAVISNFLAVTLTKQDMEKILAVKKGYLPCLQDSENFARFKMPEKSSLYFNADGEKSSDYLNDYLTQVIPVSSGFLADELNSAFIPFVKEFNRFSAIEGALYQGADGSSAEGSVSFAFKKQ